SILDPRFSGGVPMPRLGVILGCVCLLLAAAALLPAAERDPLQVDEQTLKEARLPTDGPALLEVLRKQTLTDVDRTRIQALVRKMGDDDYAVREEATQQLVLLGPVARPLLQQATKDPDIEIVRRAQHCLQEIEQTSSAPILAAAVRVLAARKPEGAVEGL